MDAFIDAKMATAIEKETVVQFRSSMGFIITEQAELQHPK